MFNARRLLIRLSIAIMATVMIVSGIEEANHSPGNAIDSIFLGLVLCKICVDAYRPDSIWQTEAFSLKRSNHGTKPSIRHVGDKDFLLLSVSSSEVPSTELVRPVDAGSNCTEEQSEG